MEQYRPGLVGLESGQTLIFSKYLAILTNHCEQGITMGFTLGKKIPDANLKRMQFRVLHNLK